MANYNPAMTPAMAAAFHQQNAASATPTNIYKVNNLPNNEKRQVRPDNFPMQMGSSDLEDEKYALQQKILEGVDQADARNRGVIPGMGQVIVGPEYFDYTKRKMEMADEVAFRDWLVKQASFNTPEEAEYWSRMFPFIPEEKLREVSRVSELQKQQARINITGPQTPEDWRFIYNVNRGLIQIPTQPVHLLPRDDTTYGNQSYYERGMFSPMVRFLPPYDGEARQNTPAHLPNYKYNWGQPLQREQLPGNRLVTPTLSAAQYGQPNGPVRRNLFGNNEN